MNCEHICSFDMQYLASEKFSNPHLSLLPGNYVSEYSPCNIFVKDGENDQHSKRDAGIA